MRNTFAVSCLAAALMTGCTGSAERAASTSPVAPFRVTEAVGDDADDPAIWIHPSDPGQSLILGTNKTAAPQGALVVFGLDGRIRQTVAGLDRPNNVDVEQEVTFGGRTLDIAAVTERLKHRLRLFSIDRTSGRLEDLASIPVLTGEPGERSEPMGVSIFKRPHDGAVFVIVAPKTGGPENYLAQYRIGEGTDGQITGRLVRRFGNFSERGAEPGDIGEIEAVVVDDERGYVYYSDEGFGIRKWHADPDHPDAGRELAVFGTTGYQMDREGLALWRDRDGTGYLVSTDQVPNATVFKFYRREGRPGQPHAHEVVHQVVTTADDTDGIEIAAADLPGFPGGLLIAMNSGARNFALFRWKDLRPGDD